MKLELSLRTKTDQEVVTVFIPVSLDSKTLLSIHQVINDSNLKPASEIRSLLANISATFEIKGGYVQIRFVFTYQRQIKWPNGTKVTAKNLLPVQDKSRRVILVLSQLSEFFPINKIKERNDKSIDLRTAAISNTNHDVLASPGVGMNLQRLCQFMNRLHLNLSDSFWSPVGITKNLRTKGSAPGENKKRVVADSINLMFVVLGWSGEKPTESIEVFDSNTQKWSFFQRDTPFIRAYHGVALVGYHLYVVGGFNGRICLSTMLCLNMRSRHWSRKSPMSIPRCYVLTIVLGGRIYAIGGHSGGNRLKTCEKFDPNRNKWTRVSDMIYRRSDAAGAEINGKILVSGGFDGFQFHATVEIYNPSSDQWTLVGSMIHPRSGHSMVSCDGHIYVLGGFNGSQRLREVERFREETNNWESFAPMLTGRSNFCTAVFRQEIFVIGGYDGTHTISSVEKFDKMKMQWQRAPNLNIHRSAAGACVMNNSESLPSCARNEMVPVVSTNIEERSP